MLKDSEHFTIHYLTEEGSTVKVRHRHGYCPPVIVHAPIAITYFGSGICLHFFLSDIISLDLVIHLFYIL